MEFLRGHPTGLTEIRSIDLQTHFLISLLRVLRVGVVVKVYGGGHESLGD
jgi:hypothetical protein